MSNLKVGLTPGRTGTRSMAGLGAAFMGDRTVAYDGSTQDAKDILLDNSEVYRINDDGIIFIDTKALARLLLKIMEIAPERIQALNPSVRGDEVFNIHGCTYIEGIHGTRCGVGWGMSAEYAASLGNRSIGGLLGDGRVVTDDFAWLNNLQGIHDNVFGMPTEFARQRLYEHCAIKAAS